MSKHVHSEIQEDYEHDDCPKCGTPSVPFENVPDQSLRGCPDPWCGHEWWEDHDRPVWKGKQPGYEENDR